MTTCLYSFLPLTAGADRMAVTDPHGWTLTLISVSVVFAALVVLYLIYSLCGKAFSGTVRHNADEGTAAAIALALELEQNNSIHDTESGVITITHHSAEWDDKTFNFRKAPSNGKL